MSCHTRIRSRVTDPAYRSSNTLTSTGFPFECAQGGEPVEPRVKPGMTENSKSDRLLNKLSKSSFWQTFRYSHKRHLC
jgi:hypothetical protein